MARHLQTYLDYNATAPVYAAVVDAVAETFNTVGNPSSVHQAGRRARARVEAAREAVAALVGASPRNIVFTSGGTEANNMALCGLAIDRLIMTPVEHESVRQIADATGAAVEVMAVDRNGLPDLEDLDRRLAAGDGSTLVSAMLANNETGVILPVAQMARIARAHGALFHTDAIQAAGKISVDFDALGVDLMSLSAHKLGGPQGVGALVVRDNLDLRPLLRGGGQELRRRAGTENIPGIVGFGVAAKIARQHLDDMNRIAALRDRLEADIGKLVPEAIVFGQGAPRLSNTTCVAVRGVSSETQIMALDLEGICVSAGSACSSGKVTPSHVLAAMGAGEDLARCAIRISLGWGSTSGDVERFLEVWPPLIARMAQGNSSKRQAS
ncbi:MAG: cysteine desulfurase [Alphaproteobacteria bacterium]|nr:MAG: cysteine desulfurase [Alphaproteobacteria bacterium]